MGMLATFRHLFHPQRSNNHRPRLLHPEAYIMFAALIGVFSLGIFGFTHISKKSGDVLGFSSTITPSEVITYTNEQREKLGLEPLRSNQALNEAALAKAQDMFSKQYWAHAAPDGTQPWYFFKQAKYEYSVAGENLARDFSNTPDMMSAWMNSPTHKANIVHGKYQEIGIAVVDGKLHGIETTLVVQFFGTPLSGVAQINDRAGVNAQDIPMIADLAPVISFAEQQAKKVQDMNPGAAVLASTSFRVSQLQGAPLFSPLQMMKTFFLAILLIVILTLLYDMFIMNHMRATRMVGKNFAHILFFMVISFLVIYFKAGVIG
jgi:hypothetical protein